MKLSSSKIWYNHPTAHIYIIKQSKTRQCDTSVDRREPTLVAFCQGIPGRRTGQSAWRERISASWKEGCLQSAIPIPEHPYPILAWYQYPGQSFENTAAVDTGIVEIADILLRYQGKRILGCSLPSTNEPIVQLLLWNSETRKHNWKPTQVFGGLWTTNYATGA